MVTPTLTLTLSLTLTLTLSLTLTLTLTLTLRSYDECTFPTPGELYGARQAKSACSSGREADGLRPRQALPQP